MDAIKKTNQISEDKPVKVFFQDEGRFGRISEPSYCWCEKGIRPLVKTQFVREYSHVYSAVCPQDGESFSLILPDANSESMEIFLREFSKQYKNFNIVVFMDRAGWHTTSSLKKFNNININYLPPYSPELNPVENFWKHIREKYLRNYFWQSLELLEDKLNDVLCKIHNEDKIIIQKLAGFHWCLI